MLFAARYSTYDSIAELYDRYWGSYFETLYFDVIEKTLLGRAEKGCSVLDLCCGSGQLAARLSRAGYRVTGIDGSGALLRCARAHAPECEFMTSDARSFTIVDKFDLALCTFDSLNHLGDLAQVASVFNNVYTSLRRGGLFFFDLNTEEGYRTRWRGSSSIVQPDHVIAMSASYAPEQRTAVTRITAFVLDKRWRRIDVEVAERCYAKDEIATRLTKSLFRDIKTFDSQKDFAKSEPGRQFFLCVK